MIELKHVSFTYQGQTGDGLQDINLTIEDGECVLFCGRSGCGKTTITRLVNGLIPQFYAGELAGSVLVDGQEVSDLPMHQIAAKVGSVFQNPRTQFFNVDTDSEIAFGIENQALPVCQLRERVDRTSAELHIENLRNRNIFELSGGEKQKIAIARALLKNAPIVILDEATSSVDPENEAELQQAIEKLTEDKTVIIIAHRLKTVRNAQQIVVIANGGIAQRGTHQELMTQPGIYADFVNIREKAVNWKISSSKIQQ